MHDSIWLGFLAADAIDLGEPPPLPHQLAPFEPVEPPAEGPDLTLPPPPEGGPAPSPGPIQSPQPIGGYDNPTDWRAAIVGAIRIYFNPEDQECAICIQANEASFYNQIRDNRDGSLGSYLEYSIGPWQINLLAHPAVSFEQAFDVLWSTSYAAGLRYNRGDWGDWACSAEACGCPTSVRCPRP